MCKKRNLFLTLLAACLCAAPANASDARKGVPPEIEALYPESFVPELRQLIEAVNLSTPALVEQQLVYEAENDVIIARANRLPRVYADLQLNITAEDRSDFDSVIWRQRPVNRISVAQPIYHWGALQAGQRVAELQVGNRELMHQRNLRNLRQRVREAYFQVLEREYSFLLAQRRLQSAERSLASVELSFDLGNVSRNQLLRAQYHVKNLEGSVFNQQQALQQVRFRLFEQTGIRLEPMGNIDQKIDQFLQVSMADIRALSEAPEIRDESSLILQNQIRQAEHRFTIERARNRPRFDVVLSVFQDEIGRTQQDSITRNNLFVGFRMVWDIFRGGDGRARQRNALSQRNRLRQGLEMSIDKLDQEFDFLQERIMQTAELLNARDQQVAAMEELYRQREVEVEQGRALEDDLFDDRISLDQARLNFVQLATNLFLLQSQLADLLATSWQHQSNDTQHN